MKRLDYFLASMKAKAHYRKSWILRTFSVVLDPVPVPVRWDLEQRDDGVFVYVPTEGGDAWVKLDDVAPWTIPCIYSEAITLQAGDVENLSTTVETTFGDALYNSRVTVYAFGALYPYEVGPVNPQVISKWIAKKLTSDPLPGEPWLPNTVYVRDYLKWGRAIVDLGGYEFFAPSITEKSMTSHPDRDKVRAAAIARHEGELDDPAVQSRIQDEMIALDKEHIKGDPSEGFMFKNKTFNTARKRMFGIHGPEAGFSEGGRATLVVNSLEEGLDITKLPEMVNSLRAGSYYRGALTALAGEDVKFLMRIFQNSSVSEKDCGSKLGLPTVVTGEWVGHYFLEGDALKHLTEENFAQYKDKVVLMRVPGYCQTSHSDYCATCMGDLVAENPDSLGSMATQVSSTFMGVMMASAHAKELKTAELDVANFLS